MTSKKTAPDSKKKPLQQTTAKLQELHLARLIPNIATVVGLCTGLSAIRFAMLGRFEEAVLAIIIAAVLDGLDGRLARLLKASSDFGAELDSLSDFICFGVSPAIVIFMLTLKDFSGFGWGVTLFYSVCMALRLARFNVLNSRQQQNDQDETIKQSPLMGSDKFFVGVPAPSGAFLALFPLMLHFATGWDFIIAPYTYSIFIVTAGLLMISRMPTYSFKSMKIPRSWMVPLLVVAAILVAVVVSAPWVAASLLIVAYVGTFPFSILAFRKLTKESSDS